MKEIKSLRKRNEKHFLNSDGTITCFLYNNDIHYKKNNDYIPIDNNLVEENSYIINKENDFKVSFLKDKRKKEIVDIKKDNHYLKMALDKKLTKNIEIDNNKIKFKEALENIDIDYELISKTLKESIIIKDKNSIPNDLSFTVNTDLRLRINKRKIEVKDDNKNIIFMIDAPYMKDSNNNYNYNINYTLIKREEDYLLKLDLDKEWLESDDTVYPVVIDPTIIDNEKGDVIDTYVYSWDNNYQYDKTLLKAGLEQNDKLDMYMTLLKFKLPTIGTGCEVVDAKGYLVSHASDIEENDKYDYLGVYAMEKDWNENTVKFDDVLVAHSNTLEDFFIPNRSKKNGNNIKLQQSNFDITNLVKKWYAGKPNYGIMIKSKNDILISGCKPYIFYSENNNVTETSTLSNPKPFLVITYRNLNGLEDYMSYKTDEFSEGASYINNLTGNLTTTFNLNETIGGKYPIGLSLIYNTNDVVLNNNIGYGLGWKFNLHETIMETEIDDNKYLEYLDADGTLHYFRYDYDDEGKLNTSKYIDEDGLGLTAVLKDNTYVVTDKNSNEYIFTKNGNIYYLTKLIDTSKNEVVIEYTNNKITKVTDANNKSLNISYNTNNIVITSEAKTTTVNYSNNKVTSIITKLGTTSFSYDSNNIITKITDTSGISYKYEYYEVSPYKIKKVTELGLNNEEGNCYNFEYGFKTTKVKDNKNRYNTYTFNEQGNTVGITNLNEENNLSNAYSKGAEYEKDDSSNKTNKANNNINANKLMKKSSINLIYNGSFEVSDEGNIGIFSRNATSESSYLGKNSGKITNNESYTLLAEGNKYYTFSAYFKNQDKVLIDFITTGINSPYWMLSDEIPVNEDYTKHSFTFFLPEYKSEIDITFDVKGDNPLYLDNIQLEEGKTSSPFNYIDNGDFRFNKEGWNFNNNTSCIIDTSTNTNYLNINLTDKNSSGFSKKIPISGLKGDTYNLSFWYKNTGIKPSIKEEITNELIVFDYKNNPTDNSKENIDLSTYNKEWQYFSKVFCAKEDYNNINFNLLLGKNVGEFSITNISLVKNSEYELMEYNKNNGNLELVQNKKGDKTAFKYDKNNQLTSMFNPMGNNFKFEYDNVVTDRVLKGISPSGISNEIKYDSFGNPIKTIINNVNPDGDIIDNKNYMIRLKGTDKYLDCNFINRTLNFKENECSHDIFTLVKAGDYYRFKIGDLYLNYTSNQLLLGKINDDSSLFKLKQNDNSSYSISPKTKSNYNLSVTNNNLSFVLEDNNDFKQQFYFEDIDTPLFIETKAEYTEDGRFITKTIDALEKTTEYDINPVNGLTNSVKDANSIITNYTYNKDQITKVTKNNKEVKYEYNNNNLLSKITSGNKNYNFSYDNFLNTKDIKINNNTLVTNTYEPNNGNISKSTYGNNSSISYTYDELDRIKTLSDDLVDYEYFYDNFSNLIEVEGKGRIFDEIYGVNIHEKHNYEYDLGQNLKKYKTDLFEINYDYDSNNNTTNKKYVYYNNKENVDYEYNKDDAITKVSFGDNNLNYTYDYLGRLIAKDINGNQRVEYAYKSNGNKTSTTLKSMKINNDLYEYTYDNLYNITDIYLNKELINHYEYDNFNELIEEDDYRLNKTIKYTYDIEGNILSKKEYELNTQNIINTNTYEYNNTLWEDQLTKFNNETITYDAIGNPLTIGNKALTWINGRQLNKYTDTDLEVEYTYNKDGIRTSKKVNGEYTNYFTEGNKIIFETRANNVIYYIRDEEGSLIGLKYNDTMYYYIKNMQEDIIGITDSNHNILCSYEYDSWGNIITIKDNNGNIITDESHIGIINPYRYRSYYYDKETKLYYLNSRYYNLEWGRFINADGIIDSSEVESLNLYKYALNNPINYNDSDGDLPKWLKKAVVAVVVVAVAVVTAAAVVSAAPAIAAATAVTAAKLGATGAMIRASMTASKVATYALGTTVAVNGASRAGEVMTGTNVIRDKIMSGNEGLYNTFETGLGIVSAATITMGQIYNPRESSPTTQGSLKTKGDPFGSTTTNKKYYNQTRYYDYKGNASLDIDFTNHPKSHSYHSNPHLHIWDATKRDEYPTNIR